MTEIELNGQKWPVKFNLNAIAEFGKINSMTYADILSLGDNMAIHHLITLTWAGIKEGARIAGNKFTATPEDVGAWLSDNIEAAFQVFQEYSGSQPAPTEQKKSSSEPEGQ